MTAKEARRIALLVILDEIERSIDTSDEWSRHPETDELLTREEVAAVLKEAKLFATRLDWRIAKMDPL